LYDVFEVWEGDFGIGPHCPLEHLFQPSKGKKFALKTIILIKSYGKLRKLWMQQLAYFESTPEHWKIGDLSGMSLFIPRFEIGFYMKMRKMTIFYLTHKKIPALRTLRIRSLMKTYSANFGPKKTL
jgi:hypothetical protein